MQGKSRNKDFHAVIPLETPSSCSSWLAKIFAVVSGVFRVLDLPKYEVLRAAIQPWLEGLAIMGYFLINFFLFDFPSFLSDDRMHSNAPDPCCHSLQTIPGTCIAVQNASHVTLRVATPPHSAIIS